MGLGRRLGRYSVFDESEFGAGMQLAKVYLIHKSSDEKDAAAGATEDIFRGKRIGDGVWIETWPLVRDANYK